MNRLNKIMDDIFSFDVHDLLCAENNYIYTFSGGLR